MTVQRIGLILIAAGLLCAGPVSAQGGDLAASRRLPAALEALGATQQQLLTSADAREVRGQGGLNLSDGTIVSFAGTLVSDQAAAAVSGVAGGQTVTLQATPSGLSIVSQGTALIIGSPRVQGAIAVATGSFNGVMAFEGGPSQVTIVALPGAFLADFR
jgi:hypothetical protein